jgi:ABC-type dipeptide/oligopeptide/nickel transport system permease component
MGLDRPLPEQYLRFMGRLVTQGEFGESVVTGTTVAHELRRAIPNTVILTVVAVVWSALLGVFVGVAAALRRGSVLDRALTSVATFGVSFPSFAVALGLLFWLAFRWDLFPLGGRGPNFHSWEGLRYLILPAIALGFDMLAQVARITRTSILETLSTDYVRTARAKGLATRGVVFKHALRPALLPVLTLMGLNFARLLSGAVVVETVFSWPGMGRLVVASILVKDMPMIQGVLFVKALLTVSLNLGVDVAYGVLDPRVKYA